MEINLAAYGIAKDILNARKLSFSIKDDATIGDLKQSLVDAYPKFSGLKHLTFAVGTDYREDEYTLSANDKVAIIPPVSGG